MGQSDVVIHIRSELPVLSRAKLEGAVKERLGVRSVLFTAGVPHVLAVAYDPQAINRRSILRQVRRWDRDAEIAGL
jgi:hypothetical protein